ncbi:hypothetical protein [Streptomyces sp. NPDC049040]|uniref:hypothetical protein n=1 Tax=Streptomyces sp. NPDC049040 TaxID=3365593 RepID=UPI003721328B
MRLAFTRAGIAAVAVAAVLALSSCSSGDKDGEKQPTVSSTASVTGQPVSPSASPPATATPEPTATTTGPAESAGSDPTQTVEGVWLATQGTTKVQLVLGQGKAALTSTHLCGGGYTDQDGVGLNLTCMDGDTERTVGRGVLAADGKTLTVRWDNGPTDVFARTGLPSS